MVRRCVLICANVAAGAVLAAGGGDHHGQQARQVHGDAPLAAGDLHGVVPAAGDLGAVSAAQTERESVIAAVGSLSRSLSS